MANAQYLITNNADTVLAVGITNVATSMQVATGMGDQFPVIVAPDYTLLTLEDENENIEIVKVTARASGSDILTIERAQDDTTARAWNAGDTVELRITHALILWILSQITAALKEPVVSFFGTDPQITFTSIGEIVMSSSPLEF